MTDIATKRLTAEELVTEITSLLEQKVYRPGDRLREQELADRFGVSRGPVREALRALEAKSLVKIEPMRGACVTRLSDKDVRDSVDISAALFGLAASKAAGCEPALITKMRDHLKTLSQMVSQNTRSKDFYLQTVRIGVDVMLAAKSDRLNAILTDIRIGAPNFYGPLGFTTPSLQETALRKWTVMIDAIASGDPETAAQMAREVHADSLKAAIQVIG